MSLASLMMPKIDEFIIFMTITIRSRCNYQIHDLKRIHNLIIIFLYHLRQYISVASLIRSYNVANDVGNARTQNSRSMVILTVIFQSGHQFL